VLVDEVQNLLPGVDASFRVLNGGSVKETMRRSRIGLGPKWQMVRFQLALEPGELGLRGEIITSDQQQQWRPHLGNVRLNQGWHTIKADTTGQAQARGRLAPGMTPAQTETDGENPFDATAFWASQIIDPSPNVGIDAHIGELLDMGPKGKPFIATLVAGGTTEVVDGNGFGARLRKPLG
jgi:hypothetical protein